MSNPMLVRATLAIEESRKLHAEKLRLNREHIEHLKALQFSILQSAILHAEIKANRDNEITANRDNKDK